MVTQPYQWSFAASGTASDTTAIRVLFAELDRIIADPDLGLTEITKINVAEGVRQWLKIGPDGISAGSSAARRADQECSLSGRAQSPQ